MSEYAIPELADAPYNDTFGWAGSNTTDPYRLGSQPLRDFQAGPDSTSEFHAIRDADEKVRESAVTQQSTPSIGVELSAPRFAPNPRATPVPVERATAKQRPSSWSFLRDMLARTPKRFNGNHFSMADHERNYEILGMEPARSARSTYRSGSNPELTAVDIPATETRAPSANVLAVRTPNPNNAYRLA